MTPLGLRQNNPGNLRPSAPPWQGVTGEANGFCVFDTMQNGIRALAKNLLAYFDAHGLDTIRGLIMRWAPNNENDTAAYIAAVATTCELSADAKINVHDFDTLYWLVVGIGEHENGRQSFHRLVTGQQLDAGVAAALGVPVPA